MAYVYMQLPSTIFQVQFQIYGVTRSYMYFSRLFLCARESVMCKHRMSPGARLWTESIIVSIKTKGYR